MIQSQKPLFNYLTDVSNKEVTCLTNCFALNPLSHSDQATFTMNQRSGTWDKCIKRLRYSVVLIMAQCTETQPHSTRLREIPMSA